MKLFSIFLLSLVAFAQSDRGTISGTVSDPAGALIPNATVTVVNQANGVKLALATTQTGNFSASGSEIDNSTVECYRCS